MKSFQIFIKPFSSYRRKTEKIKENSYYLAENKIRGENKGLEIEKEKLSFNAGVI
jgi:hypothetical protein